MKNDGKHGDVEADAGLSGFQQGGDSLFDPAAISVPFKWEEAPGKPKASLLNNTSNSSNDGGLIIALKLPPRLQGSPNSAIPPPHSRRSSLSSSFGRHDRLHLRDQINKIDGGGSRPSAFRCFKSFVKVWTLIRKSRLSSHEATSMEMWSPTLATYLYNNAKAMQQEPPSSTNNFTLDHGRRVRSRFLLQLHEDEYHHRVSLQQLLAAEDDAEYTPQPWHHIEKQAWPWQKVRKNLIDMVIPFHLKERPWHGNRHGCNDEGISS